eukprot:TRINITY_DN1439_c0_g1_i1.p3 TRINITY_DN1439_c0_g1~~TRINITY_DN1439_c0_g1_i1.p3  ORF type:complete len:252 (+),score=49.94 TRINITY_DN1439_c0_g1_i1:1087-1842(+)
MLHTVAFRLLSLHMPRYISTQVPKLVFLGAPGSGKGTYAARIAQALRIPHLSTGDMLRAQIKQQTPQGKHAQALTESGNFVPDDMITAIVQQRLQRPDSAAGWILDGFPRTAAQANSLLSFNAPSLAIQLDLPHEVIVQKMAGRRACAHCGHGYNMAAVVDTARGIDMPAMLPAVAGVCDRCGGKEFVTRKDDVPDVVQKRLNDYQTVAQHVVKFYEQQQCLLRCNVAAGVHNVLPMLLALIENATHSKKL